MKRKLFSTLLCAFALLLLMGAGVEQDSAAAAIVIEEESASADGSAQVLETGIQTGIEAQDTEEISADEIYLEAINSDGTQTSVTAEPAVALDHTLLMNGQPVPADTGKTVEQGTTYVALAAMAQTLDPSVTITWDGGSSTAAVQSAVLDLTAKVGQQYLVANGRYLYVPEGVRMEAGRVVVPLKELVKAFDAKLSWDPADGTTSITTGSGGIASGDSFYNQDDLFWLSRVVYAESGNQSLDGKIAVANVVLNRVKSPIFPNTIEGVLAQKNQFPTYGSGSLAKRTPNEGSIIAAKLAMDGAVVEEAAGALYFDSASNSWASRNKTHITTIGGHKFYG